MRFLLIVTALIFVFPQSLHAEAPPVPPSKKESLNLQKKLKEQESRKAELEGKVREIEGDLESTKGRMVEIGKSVLKNERTLQNLEKRISDLEQEQSTMEEALHSDRQSIARLVLALERIERVPPEALIARPGAPLKTAQSAMLMRDIIPAIHRQAAALKLTLTNLEVVTIDLKAKREKALEASVELKAEHDTLASLVKKREALFASTHIDLEERQQEVKRISAQASNLQDLVSRLDSQRKQEEAPKQRKAVSSVPIPAAGNAQLPISGVLTVRYDEPDMFGAPSKGVTIEGRAGALVVAPMGGVVRFAGPFKNYGNMVILEHKNGYHSLIAGLEKIDTLVGQSVSAGEPLGLLHATVSGEKPALYYELRLNGHPVNPSQKFADLG